MPPSTPNAVLGAAPSRKIRVNPRALSAGGFASGEKRLNYNRINSGLNNPMVKRHMDALFGAERAEQLRTRLQYLTPMARERTILEEIAEALKEMDGRSSCPSASGWRQKPDQPPPSLPQQEFQGLPHYEGHHGQGELLCPPRRSLLRIQPQRLRIAF